MTTFTRGGRSGGGFTWFLARALFALAALLALAAAGLVAAGLLHEPARGIAPGFEGRLVRAAGLELRVRQAGQGPDVLLVHGQGGSAEDFDAVLGPLSQRYRVTAYDRPGHGFSDPGHEVQDFEGNAFVLEALAKALELRSPVLVAHSYGGGVALEAAARAILDVRGLVLLASVGYGCRVVPCRPRGLLERAGGRLLLVPGLGTGLALAASHTVAPGIVRALADDAFAPEAGARAYVDRNLVKQRTPKCIVSNYEQERAYEPAVAALSAAYAQIRRPVVIVQGRADGFAELVPTAQRLAADIPGAELTWIDGAGHMLPLTRPAQVVAAVDRVFARLEAAAPAAPAAATPAPAAEPAPAPGAAAGDIEVEEDPAEDPRP